MEKMAKREEKGKNGENGGKTEMTRTWKVEDVQKKENVEMENHVNITFSRTRSECRCLSEKT